MISKAELKTKELLRQIGFVVKSYDELSNIDPANVIYTQVPIRNWIIDFALLNAQIALEVDGYWHNQPMRKINDDKKDVFLRKSGWKIIRIPADLIEQFPDRARGHLRSSILRLMDL